MCLDSKLACSSQELTAAQTLAALIRSPANSSASVLPAVAQAQISVNTAPAAPPAMVPALLALPVGGVLVQNGIPPIPTTLLQQPKAKTSDSTFEKNFPQKLLDILETPEHSDILKWLPGGKAFTIVDKTRFTSEDLPALLKQTQFTSFTRKLCRWKFIRIPRGPFIGAYYHKLFRRDQPDLCKLMSCNKNTTSSLNVGVDQARQRSMDSMSTILSPAVVRPKHTIGELHLNQQNSLRMLQEANNRVFMIKERLLNNRFERDRLYRRQQQRLLRQAEVNLNERQQESLRQAEFRFYEQQQKAILRHEQARHLHTHQTGTPGHTRLNSARELYPLPASRQHLPNQFPCPRQQVQIIHPQLAMNVDDRNSSNKSKILQGACKALRCGNTMEYNAFMSQLTKLRKAEMLDRAAATTRRNHCVQQWKGV
jgi:antitoxin component of MazEF toxin-antitoxin module